MNTISRRALARWAADQLSDGKSSALVAKHLAASLIESRMVNQAGFLIEDILWELEQRRTLAIGKVTSAHSLSVSLEKSLLAQIKKATGVNEVIIEKSIDKSVLGGVRVETSNHVWDSTIARKLVELKEVYK
jgi:F0F1-type ATP synthase delta subunit